LLVLEALFLVVQSRRTAALLSAGLGTLCFALAPATDGLHAPFPWLVLSNYVTAGDGSLFPLLPAAGYVFWGLTVAETALLCSRADPRASTVSATGGVARAPALRLLGWGLLSLLSARLLFSLALPAAARVSPAFAALKLGLVLLFAAFLALVLAERELPRVLTRLASETLFLYVSHVIVLYAGHVGLSALVGRSQSLARALSWTVGLLICTSLGALSYGRALRALRARFQRGTPRPQSPLPLG
jgi:hypothetical protein